MIRSILAAAILSLGVVSVALAFTPSPATSPQVTVTTDVLQVGHKGGHKGGKWHAKRHDKFVHAHRYSHAPKGWRNYSYRPYRWSHRGCVIIGSLWYCP